MGSYCDKYGQAQHWDNFNCKTTTVPPTTTTPPTTPPQLGCYENGKFYPPGTEMSSGYDESSNWCYGSYCDKYGQVQHWDNFNCKTTTVPTTTTTPPTTPQFGCYENGKFYPPGTKISSGYDESSNWCYGSYCDKYGQVQHWDNFNCKTTTVPPTTTTGAPAPTSIPCHQC